MDEDRYDDIDPKTGAGASCAPDQPRCRHSPVRPASKTDARAEAFGHVADAGDAAEPHLDDAARQGASPRDARPSHDRVGRPSRVQPGFVRQRAARLTQDAIDDLAEDGASAGQYAHDSNVAVRGGMRAGAFTGGAYRRTRSGMGQVRGSRYGQYLEIPKGRRSIFVSQEQARRRKSIKSFVALIVFLALAALVIGALVRSIM
ncbi:hypothetical protein [Olsenella sp. HMSC062G07]|uniref:hypothetical protein n=1 Tax=Olsenella sp. HMSC062G07 TaxID=1739330 RepID=UPI0008A62501|nr:hypothetical protein [Olsenella sp. HMSC062G07]OFK25287.1 hypothetical protein HMPREF2826_03035 [Olsenella sp. HMSC062G07]